MNHTFGGDRMVYVGLHGDTYKSITKLASAYDITYSALYNRIKKQGLSSQEALLDILNNTKKYEGLHNDFYSTLKDVAIAYNIKEPTLYSRLSNGMNLEEALSSTVIEKSNSVFDHNNKKFNSMADLCREYNIDRRTLRFRLNNGWSLKDALEIPVRKTKKRCEDHLGQKFDSVSSMCRAHNIKSDTFERRIKAGWNIEMALTVPADIVRLIPDAYIDKYGSVKNMCESHGIALMTLYGRLKRGMSIDEALNTELHSGVKDGVTYRDHNGKVWKTKKEMCDYYGITVEEVRKRLAAGWTLEEALTFEKIIKTISDGLGNNYKSLYEMVNAYNMIYTTVLNRIRKGLEVQISLIVREAKVDLEYIGLDRRARYKISWSKNPVTARQIIEHCRPDLLSAYDKCNPTGEYKPYRLNKEDNTDE